jgi:iron complex outermembrane receptor protein
MDACVQMNIIKSSQRESSPRHRAGSATPAGPRTAVVSAVALLLAGGPSAALAQVGTQAAAAVSEVTITAARDDSFRAQAASVAGEDNASLRDTPASVSVYNRALLDAQQSKLLSDVVRNDASVDNAYAPIGFYQGFAIRGFGLDTASAFRIDGLTIAGEQNVALENKEQVEILKGLASIASGVIAPGGVVNFVTKRAADVASIRLETDQRGSASGAVDLGRRFGDQRQFGVRINAAKEAVESYVKGADANRSFASIATDWKINPAAALQLDAEYQRTRQRSVSGYQLLGGTALPSAVSTSKLLGAQSWEKPTTINALNLSGRLDVRFSDDWQGYVAVGRSRSLIDDNAAFAYGCFYVASCATGGTSPYFFSANGDYDVYDYRSPDEYRRNDEVKSVLSGNFNTGGIRHDVTLGLQFQRRVVAMTDAVYDYVGTENIADADTDFSPSPNSPSASYRHLDARQYSAFGLDRIHLGDQWQLLLGGRQLLLRQKTWASIDGAADPTERTRFLPQGALVYKPADALSLYGSYSQALSLGDQAPARASNAGEFLAPVESHQFELGAKFDWSARVSLTAALFDIDKPFEFAQPDASDAGYTFVQQGREVHQGLELGASGRVTDRLMLNATLAAIRARAHDTGAAAYEGHQVSNVPRLAATFFADYALPVVDGLHVQGGANFASRKNANEEGTVSVPSYAVFNLGANYTTRIADHKVVARLTVDNLFDKTYWQDAGELLGDAYLFLGAPRTARLSLTYDF